MPQNKTRRRNLIVIFGLLRSVRHNDKNMNSSILKLRSGFTLVALAIAFSAGTARAGQDKMDEKKIVASIQPKGKVEPADLPALAKISYAAALKTAETAAAGTAIKGELEVEGGNLMYSFDVVTAGKKVLEVEVDAGDGKVLDIDAD
jgi:uncharacterized membrane protein YkoI